MVVSKESAKHWKTNDSRNIKLQTCIECTLIVRHIISDKDIKFLSHGNYWFRIVFKSLSNHDDFILRHKNIHFGPGFSLTIVDIKHYLNIFLPILNIWAFEKLLIRYNYALTFKHHNVYCHGPVTRRRKNVNPAFFIVVACVCHINITIYYAVSV